MDKSPESRPFDEVERLCALVKVRFEPYDLAGSLVRVLRKLQTCQREGTFWLNPER